MKSTATVKKNYEFRRMYAKGKSGVSSCLVVYYRKNRLGHNRLGVTVSTKLGHAVVRNRVRRRIREIENNKDATAVEQDLMTTLEVCYEFCLRGFHFEPIDIYRSDATKFVVTENGLLPPFTSVRGLGETAALDTVEKRKGKDFTSVEEFSLCCNKLSQTHIDQLRALGAFAGLPETSQLTLF